MKSRIFISLEALYLIEFEVTAKERSESRNKKKCLECFLLFHHCKYAPRNIGRLLEGRDLSFYGHNDFRDPSWSHGSCPASEEGQDATDKPRQGARQVFRKTFE